MSKIAVNPTQFITCRLCLEELGSYQIVPSVQEQIEYCFNIKVEPFDGLPQLICQKCETILDNVSKIKKKFAEKQDELRSKIYSPTSVFSNYENLSAAQQPQESQKELESKNNIKRNKPIKRKPCISSSSSDLEDMKEHIRTNGRSCSNEEKDVTWPASYTKQFVCRICSSHWSSVKALKSHIGRKHSAFYKKYGHILKRHCQVTLHKSDGKHNVTRSAKVVYDKHKIVNNVNADYHIIYITEDYKGNEKYDEVQKKIKHYFSSESSDDEILVKRKRTRRLCSRSSTETIVIDSNSKMLDNDENKSRNHDMVQSSELCINIDDSDSDAESAKSADIKKQTLNKYNFDLKDASTVRETITSCENKYIKKHYQDTTLGKNPSDIANKLQHKIFSIGRKIINKRIGVNCIPLLRFMEHKNLDIAWLSREIVNISQDSNHIRIIPRRKNAQEKTEDYETGWVDCQSNSSKDISKETHNELKEQNEMDNPVSISNMTVISDANTICTDTKKLLNANPVANPKQLPKKFAIHEPKLAKITLRPDDIPQQEIDSGLYMPIITSTTSLAVSFAVNDNSDSSMISEIDSTTDKQQTECPRIKVKDVSKLMSEETLNRMQNPMQSPTQTPTQNTLPGPLHIPVNIISKKRFPLKKVNSTPTLPVMMPTHRIVQMQPNGVTNLIAPEPAWQSEFMMLDTIELPNTRTNSPYTYLKLLLQTHNITLLDTHVELNEGFHCLIKFKVQYKQEYHKNEPVILCLALYCSSNVFCFKVKDRNNVDLDITTLSANWQWEVLKIYKGEVVNKLLNNAQAIGQDVLEFTKTFLCLLKSINIVPS